MGHVLITEDLRDKIIKQLTIIRDNTRLNAQQWDKLTDAGKNKLKAVWDATREIEFIIDEE